MSDDLQFARKMAFETEQAVSVTLVLATVLRGRADSGPGAVALARQHLHDAAAAGDLDAANAYDDALAHMLKRGWDRE